MIITIVGGGSTYTAGIVKSIALRREELEVDEIRLYDIDPVRQGKVAVLVKWVLEEELHTDIKLVETTDKETAYKDADFIFAQMRVGGYKMREQDEKIPLRHGCVGQETCGTGGMAYGMRTIFPMIEMIDDVEKYAKPTYWILNYSNPASIVSEACRKLRPKARIINICDMPIAIIDVVAAAMEIKDKENIVYDYFGLNHFGWFTSIEYKGKDLMEPLRAYIKEHEILLPDAYLKDKQALSNKSAKGNRHAKGSWYYVWKGEYEILENFPNYLPNTYLNYYLQQKEFVEHSNVEYTRANEVMESREKNLFDGIDKYIETGVVDETSFYAGSHGDWIADLAIALKNNTKARFLVITENRGAIPNMPYDAMVEVPAYIGKNGPEVIAQNPIPLFQQGLMMQQLNSEKLVVEACIEGSYQKALEAFTLNKTVPSMNVAKAILDDMIEANKEYWPELK
ncbi:6-phospho-alpha-glucosidase [Floccifex sp.]|uniref:6-phospho-alpha-glucosidase n=1 Tax=Floccifex sp. TaxID=2815810 RepID=UPI002A75C6BB|nr:6-phospho-alpha-glucosidase [Floccifex sp.]MDD7280705.1 6-phospho-alpha-glucosidase [Erysipelotrichaceae bacterium]MDY2959135.1 6-phospho-alpha-glucosidase [Floccifex sp.]